MHTDVCSMFGRLGVHGGGSLGGRLEGHAPGPRRAGVGGTAGRHELAQPPVVADLLDGTWWHLKFATDIAR
jgi:hypothetical protein